MIECGIVDCENVMQCDRMPLRHPLGAITECPQIFPDVIDNGPFILCCKDWLVITVLWILEPLAGEFL